MSAEEKKDWMRNLISSKSSDLPLFANPEEVEEYFNEQISERTIQHKDKNPELGASKQEIAKLVPKDLPAPNQDEAATLVPDRLDGEVFLPEDRLKYQPYTPGPIGCKFGQEPEPKSKKDLKIMYGNRDLLDLGSNLVGEFWIMNRWQVGPEAKGRWPSSKDRNEPKKEDKDHYYPGIPPYYY